MHIDAFAPISNLPYVTPIASENARKAALPHPKNLRDVIYAELDKDGEKASAEVLSGGVIEIAAKVWRVKPCDITGKRRSMEFVLPRFAVCAELRCRGMGLRQIANQLGNRDHGTVYHAIKACLNELQVSRRYRPEYKKFPMALKDAGI